jgi:AcrR family transcriptional regulator
MRDGQDTKERIERAAISLFCRQGYAGTSIRDIAKAAQVSQGALYNHYVSKEDLAWSLFSRCWVELAIGLRERARQAPTFREKLRDIVRYIFEFYDKDPELVTFVYFSRHEHLRRVTVDLPNPYLVLKTVLLEAMARNEIPHRDPEAMATMVAGTMIQMIDTKALGRFRQDLGRLTDLVADGCWRLVSEPGPETAHK